MNLATRCTACGTIFRVVQDQLKVSDGWVRCGRCQAVFNAQQHLFDLEREAPPAWEPAAAAPDATAARESTPDRESSSATPGHTGPETESTAHEREPLPDPVSTSDALSPETEVERETNTDLPHPHDDLPDEIDAASDGAEAEPVDTALTTVEADAFETDSQTAEAAEPSATDDESARSTPEFVRQAERDERWEQTPVRAALALIAVLAALALALQITGHYRQRIAAQWPQSTPWLQRYCAVFGCRLDALRRIDDVSIESTALTQADASLQDNSPSNALRLAVTLRNRGELPIAMPSVDLSLTGADGELVSRRSLSPADFQVNDPRLTPGVDAPLSVSFSVTGRRVSGYTVEVFYP